MSRTNSSIVTINLSTHPPKTPLGILLAPSFIPHNSLSTNSAYNSANNNNNNNGSNNITLLAGWEHLPTPTTQQPQLGPIQRSGLVRLGDRLVQINGKDILDIPFPQVMETLRRFLTKGTLKSMGFATTSSSSSRRNSREWNPGADCEYVGSSSIVGESSLRWHERRGYSFTSFVNRWRVMVENATTTTSSSNDRMKDVDIEEREEEEEEDELEQHLNKEPYTNNNSNSNSNNNTASNQSPTTPPRPYIQYEIQCHLSFHTKSIRKNSTSSNNHANTYTWSVWKRYSEIRLLDVELRGMHGWQMDALEDGRGITFPRERYLETLWYDVYGAVNSYLFGTSSSGTDDKDDHVDGNEYVKDTTTIQQHSSTIKCPYPTQFITKRQKELQSYWNTLMRLEDIFEFDIHHPKYSKVMSSFLEVDGILMKRSAAYSVASNRRPAVIREEMVEGVGGISNDENGLGELMLPLGSIPILGREEDEVSLLSDGTGLRDNGGGSGVGGIPSSLSGVYVGRQPKVGGVVSASSSVVSGSSVNSKRRMGPRYGAKPAFQREFLGI